MELGNRVVDDESCEREVAVAVRVVIGFLVGDRSAVGGDLSQTEPPRGSHSPAAGGPVSNDDVLSEEGAI